VNCIVARKTLSHETNDGAASRLKTLGKLVLYDSVEHRVRLETWEFSASLAVMRFGEPYSLLFIECEPELRIGCDFRIVALHGVLY
jgi:hypothetical protein